jgi:hypothetical protein
MNKSELIKLLNDIEGDPIIVLSRDAEGNGFNKLSDIELSSYDHSTREIGLIELTDDLRKEGYSEEDVLEGERAVVLWP